LYHQIATGTYPTSLNPANLTIKCFVMSFVPSIGVVVVIGIVGMDTPASTEVANASGDDDGGDDDDDDDRPFVLNVTRTPPSVFGRMAHSRANALSAV